MMNQGVPHSVSIVYLAHRSLEQLARRLTAHPGALANLESNRIERLGKLTSACAGRRASSEAAQQPIIWHHRSQGVQARQASQPRCNPQREETDITAVNKISTKACYHLVDPSRGSREMRQGRPATRKTMNKKHQCLVLLGDGLRAFRVGGNEHWDLLSRPTWESKAAWKRANESMKNRTITSGENFQVCSRMLQYPGAVGLVPQCGYTVVLWISVNLVPD